MVDLLAWRMRLRRRWKLCEWRMLRCDGALRNGARTSPLLPWFPCREKMTRDGGCNRGVEVLRRRWSRWRWRVAVVVGVAGEGGVRDGAVGCEKKMVALFELLDVFI